MGRPEALRLTEEIRRLIELAPHTLAPDAELGALADAIAAVNARLAGQPLASRWYETEDGSYLGYLDHSPLTGRRHPLAPPLRLERLDGGVRGHVAFTSAYEGPPGCVHGGFVAAAFDEVFGAAQAVGTVPGFTGTLRVTYRTPTPLNQELIIDARVERVSGRKIFVAGTCTAGDRVTAEGDAIFLSVGNVAQPDLA